jgi:hypothetical protein
MMKRFKAFLVSFAAAALTSVSFFSSSASVAASPGVSAEEFLELCSTGTPEQVQTAIKAGANVNAKNEDGSTALMYAAIHAARFSKNPEVISILVKAGADVNARDNDGWMALDLVRAGNATPEVVSVLVKAGADVNAMPEDVFTFENGAWRVKSGGKLKKFAGLSGSAKDHGGPIEWCVVNPAEQEEARGLKAGVLLYVKHIEEYGPPYVFLLLDKEAAQVDGVSLDSPDAAVISREGRFTKRLSVYFLAPIEYAGEGLGRQLESYKSFPARSGAVFWVRTAETEEQGSLTGLAFTLADGDARRPEAAGLFGSTTAVFTPNQGVERVNGGLVVVKKATKTESYEVTGVSGDGKELILSVTSVKSEKDWADPGKWRKSKIKVKIPPGAEEAMPG